jgi:DNA-binding MarR family transcriptional regulator
VTTRLAKAALGEGKKRKSVASLLRLTHRLYSRALLAALQESNVTTIVQWWILRTLWTEDGLTQRQLGERLGLYESAVVAVLDQLGEKNLLMRVRNEEDRRKVNVHLTKAGRALEARLLPLADGVNLVAATGLDRGELDRLWQTLSVLHDNLEAHVQKTGNTRSKLPSRKVPVPAR